MAAERRAQTRAEHEKGVMGSLLQPALCAPYCPPRAASRVGVSDMAAEHAERNRGTLQLFVDSTANAGDRSARQPARLSARAGRVVGESGQENLRRSYGSVGGILRVDENRGYASARPQPRLPSDAAREIAEKSTGAVIQKMLDHLGERSTTGDDGGESARGVQLQAKAAPTGVYGENAERGKGTMSTVLDHTEKYLTARRPPRVKPEASEMAAKHVGMCHQVLSGQVPGDPIMDVRVAGKGKEIYEQHRGAEFKNMMTQYGKLSVPDQPESRVKGDGKNIAKVGTQGTVCHLFNNYGNLPRSARRGVRKESRKYARRNEGTMAKALSGKAF